VRVMTTLERSRKEIVSQLRTLSDKSDMAIVSYVVVDSTFAVWFRLQEVPLLRKEPTVIQEREILTWVCFETA
jgi:hypothetical protein